MWAQLLCDLDRLVGRVAVDQYNWEYLTGHTVESIGQVVCLVVGRDHGTDTHQGEDGVRDNPDVVKGVLEYLGVVDGGGVVEGRREGPVIVGEGA